MTNPNVQTLRVNQSVALRNAGNAALAKQVAPCSLYKGMHLFVFVGERGGDDLFRCACMAEMRNAKDAWYPDETRYRVVEQVEEDEALAAIPDAQESVLNRQLLASLNANRAVCEHGTVDPDNPHDPCIQCAVGE